jgi:thiol-disulfide isomerase/thioredoxin
VKTEVNKVKFWTPLRLACTVISLGLLAAFGVSSCNSNDPPSTTASANRAAAPNRQNPGFITLTQSVLDAENPGANGAPIKLGNYSGKVLLVNLWATWCGPCRMETPELVKLNKEFKDKGVEMIGLSTEDPDASAESVNEFVRAYNVDYQIGWAKREVALALMQGRTNIPQSFIIARDGRILKRFIGFNPQSTPPQLKLALEQALAGG